MTLSIISDPERPMGGYALFSMPSSEMLDNDIIVAIFDPFSGRYLGVEDWQTEKIAFGPYEYDARDGVVEFVVGPEIVNQLEEYAALEIEISGTVYKINWPDTVIPHAGAAVLGGFQANGPREHVSESNLVTGLPLEEDDTPAPEPAEPEHTENHTERVAPTKPAVRPTPEPEEEPEEPKKPGKKRWLLLLVLLVILGIIAAAVVYFLYPNDEPVSGPETVTSSPSTENDCSLAGLTKGGTSFSEQMTALSGCADSATPDTALGLLEEGKSAENAEALLAFGMVYDPSETEPLIEGKINLDLGNNARLAAEYYFRAKAAGSNRAGALLQKTCAQLKDKSDTLSLNAVDSYCR